MKLTDQEIEKNANHKYPMELYGPETHRVIKEMKFVRDFYEKQKCVMCRIENICPIRKYATSKIPNFGCTEWEPRK